MLAIILRTNIDNSTKRLSSEMSTSSLCRIMQKRDISTCHNHVLTRRQAEGAEKLKQVSLPRPKEMSSSEISQEDGQ
ncbi:hypothetical protein FHL15_004633 [Xylaria flabelliformis]|uniref:Uncharacterized protein n=1 Tax=Xylaria flabelliformis TaxID=2512241 RepID=A0A553I2P8_9PEZI|nr:hypothetical protein FHL15_004633 [Xylaria flabelliformis]